ncbi:MAG: endonuclease/exonuclease/phosphatase family protein [Micromonosporaceae bacterium]
MRRRIAYAALACAVVAGLALTALPARAATGTLSVTASATSIEASYGTDRTDAENWIGVYPDPGGPVGGSYTKASLRWAYAPSASGTVTLAATGLAPGRYVAFFLYDGGYATGLAAPYRFRIPPGGANSLALDRTEYPAGTAVTAAYRTDRPDDQNWVGVYTDPGNAPVDGASRGAATAWRYAPGGSGSVTLSTTGLAPGAYVAYYLHNDGYASLATPVRFRIVGADTAPPRFLASSLSLPQARAGAGYLGSLAAVVVDPDGGAIRYRKASGPSWLTIDGDGGVRGLPSGSDVGAATLTVDATDAAGRTTRGSVSVVVRGFADRLVPQSRMGSFNTWHAGTRVTDGVSKGVGFLLGSGVDVVGMTEINGSHIDHLVARTGWYATRKGDSAVLSRYPIVESYTPDTAGLGAKVRLGDRDVVFWTVHLAYTPYGPYDACFDNMTNQQIIARETSSGRLPQINAILSAMKPALDAAKAGGPAVFLTGDFNAPSHRDWIDAAKDQHCDYAVDWPVSNAVENTGLVDSYRVIRPSPVTDPGNTWSPVYPRHDGGTGVPEPQDRIDFIYGIGPVTPTGSAAVVYGAPTPYPNHTGNAWPSDHAAVVSTYQM